MDKSYVRIKEEPAEKSFRFRYESEGRWSGSIHGENSTHDKTTYPSIEISNCTGFVAICISCVTNEIRPKQHPHKLATKSLSNTGEIWRSVKIEASKVVEFKDLCVIFVKKQDIKKSLELRRRQNIDPTKGGWDQMMKPHLIDLHCVRLCFEVLLSKTGSYSENRNDWKSLGHVISKPILDKKSNGLLKITEISSQKAPVTGGKQIILLCDKVKREDISVVFYEEDADRNQIWREEIQYKNSTTMKVHHQYAISFKTPRYDRFDFGGTRRTFIQLCRPSDGACSDPIAFEFTQVAQSIQLRRKKQKKMSEELSKELLKSITKTKKPEKTKCGQVDNALMDTNRNNAVERMIPQTLIDLVENEKENIHVNIPMNNQTHVQAQNIYQGSVQMNQFQQPIVNTNLYEGQCNNYLNSYGYFGEPSNLQTTYNHGRNTLPTMYPQQHQQQQLHHQHQHHHHHQQQQQHQQHHEHQHPQPFGNIYPNGHDYMDRFTVMPTQTSTVHTLNPDKNYMPSTYNNTNNISSNKPIECPVNNTQGMNQNSTLSELLADNSLLNLDSSVMKMLDVGEINDITNSLEIITLNGND
ncbi:embryonic polarity protein dorsal-like [Contarinia nasturtii]|uniref:embryonic polarity protein dorsal-like n=1 Tax=Contarinia nasturtii TaxID=265458 RepID=UPI0012D43F01|nr:embryonic polarity protein dorsal-like [Contarinia nasturtii]